MKGLDDVAVAPLVPASVAHASASQVVEGPNRVPRDRELRPLLMDQLQGVSVPAHLLFVPVSRTSLSEQDRDDARLIDLHALDPV